MNKVAYVLGAGFSAPLGLPVMSNFLIKSKDLYFSDINKYKHFQEVFTAIHKLSISKNYFDTNLFNIEEILSILEMRSFLEGKRLKKAFSNYIKDVILYYAPKIKPYESDLPGNWNDFIFGGDNIREHFAYFAANLCAIKFEQHNKHHNGRQEREIYASQIINPETRYAIISLNYDLVLEDVCDFINSYSYYKTDSPFQFNKENDPKNWEITPLAKLHGSVDIDLIVPPTWAKGVQNKIAKTWKNAYQILLDSNHIRFLGYSLPLADSYIKYLLKSAVVNAPHLKCIDVVCLDTDNTVRDRYDDFIKFNYYRFANADLAEYMKKLREACNERKGYEQIKKIEMNKLENVHEAFMEQYSK